MSAIYSMCIVSNLLPYCSRKRVVYMTKYVDGKVSMVTILSRASSWPQNGDWETYYLPFCSLPWNLITARNGYNQKRNISLTTVS